MTKRWIALLLALITCLSVSPAVLAASDAAPADDPAPAEDAALIEEDPALIEEDPALIEEDPAIAEEDPAIAEEDPAITEEDPALAEEDPAITEEDPAIAEEDPAIAEEEPAITEEDPAITEEDPAIAGEDPAPAEEAPVPENEADEPIPDAATEEDEEEKDGWIKEADGKWHYYSNGYMYADGIYWVDENGCQYAFDETGAMVTGWYKFTWTEEDGTTNYCWWFFNSDGTGFTGWKKDSKNWYYLDDGEPYRNGYYWIEEDDSSYYFDEHGAMATGWQLIDGIWHYFDSDGKGYNGWVQDSKNWYYMYDGYPFTDGIYWIEEEGDYVPYAFDSQGRMLANAWYHRSYVEYRTGIKHDEWMYFGSSGRGHNGWAKDSKYWYYCEDGRPYKGGVYWLDEDTCYAFDASGHMLTGWYKDSWTYSGTTYTEWYYFDSNGKGRTGFVTSGGKKYYIENGLMLTDCIHDCGGVCYQIGSDGVVGTKIAGWKKINGEWYYANSDGSSFTGWLKSSGKWYYVRNCWCLSDGVYTIDGTAYAFDANGVYLKKVTGWYKRTWTYNGTTRTQWYYANSDGSVYTGWLKSGGKWYYIYKSRAIQDDTRYVNGVRYGFDADGAMVTGWFSETWNYVDGTTQTVWYYFDSDGKGHNGWVKDSKYWYYCENGEACHWGTTYIDGKSYAFDSNGHMVTGWYKETYYYEDGTEHSFWCYFNSDGTGFTGWKKDSKNWYYFEDGQSYHSGVHWVEGTCYAFDEQGRMQTGWFADVWYDADANGDPVKHTDWYYFESSGKGRTGLATDSSHTYYCSNGRVMKNYYINVDGVQYYCDANGYATKLS